MDRDTAARSAARQFWNAPAIYRDLMPGRHFRFPASPEGTVLVMGRLGWYTEQASGRRYRTGVRAAVIPLDGNSGAT